MKVVVIGGVAGGPSFATRLRRLNEDMDIVMFERGDHISYASCALPYYLGGVLPSRDVLIERTPEILRQKNNIDVRIHEEVTAIDPDAQTLTVSKLETGETYTETYDRLVLSTGARPVLPPIKGLAEAKNVFTLRNVTDADHIKAFIDANQPKKATIVGAGAAGIEIAENFQRLGMQITLVDQADRVMTPYDTEITDIVAQHLRDHDVNLRLNETVANVADGGQTVVLADGSEIDTDILMLVTGVTPNNEVAQAAGVALADDGHIIVNDQMKTNVPNIYAIGDVVETTSLITGLPIQSVLSSAANRQGHLLADIINGADMTYPGFIGVSVAKLFDLTASSVGYTEMGLQAAGITDYETVFVTPFDHASFYPDAHRLNIKLLFIPSTGQILGGEFLGERGVDKRSGELSAAIAGGLGINDLPNLELPYSPPYSSTRDPLNVAGYVAINQRNQALNTIKIAELSDEDKAGAQFLDIREAGKPASGSIKADFEIPLSVLRDELDQLDAAKPVYILARKGLGPYNASRILAGKGFKVKIVAE